MALINAVKGQIDAIQKEMDNIVSVIAKTASNALVVKLNELDSDKNKLLRKLSKAESQCEVNELTENELLHSFKQARKMLRSGELSTVKALVERYVQRVTINGEHIEVEFNLDVSKRIQKETSQHTVQSDSVMFRNDQQSMLATYGGAYDAKYEPFDYNAKWVRNCYSIKIEVINLTLWVVNKKIKYCDLGLYTGPCKWE